MNLKEKKVKTFYKNFGTAVLAVLAAAVVTRIIPELGGGKVYFLFLAAIIFSTIYGDIRAGGFALLLSFFLCFLLFDYHGQSSDASADMIVLLVFGLTGFFTIIICYEKEKAETARRIAESRYRMIFEDAITGIYETTLDGRYTAANPQLANIFGYASPADLMKEAANLNDRFYVGENRRREFMRLIETNKSVAGFESEIYRRDGEKIWITENSVAVRDKNGKLLGFQGTTIEITDRKRAEAALQKARAELEEKVLQRTAELAAINEALRSEMVERQNIENELLAAQRQQRELSAHLLSVREEERKRIAREVHDELGQTLIALKIDLTRISDKIAASPDSKVRAQLGERLPVMLGILDAAMNKTRAIITDLRPGVLDELGLAAAVEWQVQEFQKRTGIKCKLRTDFTDAELTQDLTTALFRILQECLVNIARHSSAKGVKIKLQKENDSLLLQVEDDGRGISPTELEKRNSFGILGIRERASLLGGTVKIERVGERSGTRVTIQLPSGAGVGQDSSASF